MKGSGNIVFQIKFRESTIDQISNSVMDASTNISNETENDENLKLIDDFAKLNEEKKERAWKRLTHKDVVERFAFSLGGTNFGDFDKDLQNKIWNEVEKNNEFAKGLGSALGVSYPRLGEDISEREWNIINTNKYFAYSFGHSLSQTYDRLDIDTQNRITQASRTISKFAEGVIMALGKQITSNPKLQDYVFSLIEVSPGAARSFAFSLDSKNFREMDGQLQEKIWSLAEKNTDFAAALGESLGEKFSLLDKPDDLKLYKII